MLCPQGRKYPQIAVAVVIEHGIYGSYAAPIAREIITEYLKLHSPDDYTDETPRSTGICSVNITPQPLHYDWGVLIILVYFYKCF